MWKPTSIAGACALTLATVAIAAACNDLDEPVVAATTDAGVVEAAAPFDGGAPADAPSAEGDAVAPTTQDPAIAQVLLTANQSEVALGQLVQRIAVSPEVQIFASSMVTEHSAAIDRETALFQTLGITPTDSATSRELQSASDTLLARMLTLRGSNVDRIYIASQVAVHAEVLDLIDTQLLPAATAPELVTELQTLRTAVTAHLVAARRLQVQ
jgi:putative membrane protein